MSTRACFVLVFFGVFFSIVVGDSCKPYTSHSGEKHSYKTCWGTNHCCGSCINRYCCPLKLLKLDDDDQEKCDERLYSESRVAPILEISASVVGAIVFISIIICCCVCPCCCCYKMCRQPSPVVNTHTTTVTTSYPVQPAVPFQGGPYPGYQQVPMQPGYANQPMAATSYQGQPYPPAGAPPAYQEAAPPVYPPSQMPFSQMGYNAGQPAYPLQPPPQPAYAPAHPPIQPDYNAQQPPYNPAYMEPPRTGN